MAITKIVNLQNDPFDVYIGRDENDQPGEFGNPFIIGEHGTRDIVLEKYIKYFNDRLEADPIFKQKIRALKGKTLGCYCKPKSCHGDVIATYVNSFPEYKLS